MPAQSAVSPRSVGVSSIVGKKGRLVVYWGSGRPVLLALLVLECVVGFVIERGVRRVHLQLAGLTVSVELCFPRPLACKPCCHKHCAYTKSNGTDADDERR